MRAPKLPIMISIPLNIIDSPQRVISMITLYEFVGVSQILRLSPELLQVVNENIYESVSNLYVKFSDPIG